VALQPDGKFSFVRMQASALADSGKHIIYNALTYCFYTWYSSRVSVLIRWLKLSGVESSAGDYQGYHDLAAVSNDYSDYSPAENDATVVAAGGENRNVVAVTDDYPTVRLAVA
jgi:hypothetical protein